MLFLKMQSLYSLKNNCIGRIVSCSLYKPGMLIQVARQKYRRKFSLICNWGGKKKIKFFLAYYHSREFFSVHYI